MLAWALWDWGSSSWNAVIVSFVFGPYVVRGVVGDARPGGFTANTWLGISTAVAGLLIALVAPVTGQRSDAGGHRRRNLPVWSALVFLVMLAMFGVRDEPSYLWLALVLLAAGGIFNEFAGVSYNAMLPQVSTPATIGRVSGFGWSMGYFGGIFLLLICYFGFIEPEVGWFGVDERRRPRHPRGRRLLGRLVPGLRLGRLLRRPRGAARPGPAPGRHRSTPTGCSSATCAALWRRDRNAVRFLIASALYRDGLAAVFSFGAILAVSVYGMAQSTVLVFGVAANVVAALGALVLGRVEDVVGPKRIIMISLVGLIVSCVVLLFVRGTTLFWVFGLALCLWVGPAQASSRSFLARIAPKGREGEMFGLYTTTGRAASFLAPALFALFSALFSDRVGIVGIALVLAAGALAMTRVTPPRSAEHIAAPVS